ncbi:hypothetical protein [Vibrio rotiferianus]|uniref:hypothetical protein n=1 Tax=Vibrio rotiferianus TaxID=190895 RepID=UPI0015F50617|nr:hypothetical protein [Vibrio rotiferianus]
MAYQQGMAEYATEITELMLQKGKATTEWKAARSINKAMRKNDQLDIFTLKPLFLMREGLSRLMSRNLM